MAESAPPKGRGTATRRETSSEGGSGRSAPGAPRIRVRYYKRMRPNKAYPVHVTWRTPASGRSASSDPVTVRLVMGGAQVVPAEQPLDLADPDAHATFYVTPLAKGWLRGERLEVVQNG